MITCDIMALIRCFTFEIGCRPRYEYTLFHCGTPYQVLNIIYVIIEAHQNTLFHCVCVPHLLRALHRKYKRICSELRVDGNRILNKYL